MILSHTGGRSVCRPARHPRPHDGEGRDPGRGPVGGRQDGPLLAAQATDPRIATRKLSHVIFILGPITIFIPYFCYYCCS